MDKFHKKLASWKGALLSQAGKIQLLESSLQILHVYALSLFEISAKFADGIEKIQKSFLWLGVEERKRISLIARDKFCRPKKLGGLGLRNIKTIDKALLAKQIWRLFGKTSEWNLI